MASTIALNPFIVGGALSDLGGRGFFGRDDVFAFVRSSLMVVRRVPILLHGQRRIGKSSILKQLRRHLPADYACIYFDLQGKATMAVDQVLYGLGRAIADQLGIDRPKRHECAEARFPAYLHEVVGHLDGRPERLVLLLDEFDVVDQAFTGTRVAASRFIPYLAQLLESHPGAGYVLVVGRKTEELSQEFFSTLLKDSVSFHIGRLSEEQTGRLARESAAGQLLFDDGALKRLYEITAGHPYCAQVLCHTIWTRAVAREPTNGRTVTPDIVDEAVPAALELGSNGLNWIYDGLNTPSHRLMLSALAESADPLARKGAPLDVVDRTLRDRRIALDPGELGVAPRLLVKWDILAGDSSSLAFAVPMIGAWIRQNRSVETLQHERELANPRAQRYYELALQSLRQDQYDAAVEDFRNALAANPAFVEALQGLASALRLRKKPGDLDTAVEAYERALDLSPGEPRTPLMELLAESIDGGGDVATITAHFHRLAELDSAASYLPRARRVLRGAARAHESRATNNSLAIAEELYVGLGDYDDWTRVEHEQGRRRRFRRFLLAVSVACGVAAFNPGGVLARTAAPKAALGMLATIAGAALCFSMLMIVVGLRMTPVAFAMRFTSIVALGAVGGLLAHYVAPAEADLALTSGIFGGMIVLTMLLLGIVKEEVKSKAAPQRPAVRVTRWASRVDDDPSRKLLDKLAQSWRSAHDKGGEEQASS